MNFISCLCSCLKLEPGAVRKYVLGLTLRLVLYYQSFGATHYLHFWGLSLNVFILTVVFRLELTWLLKVKTALGRHHLVVLLNLWNVYNCTA